jgi:hypothetical protein
LKAFDVLMERLKKARYTFRGHTENKLHKKVFMIHQNHMDQSLRRNYWRNQKDIWWSVKGEKRRLPDHPSAYMPFFVVVMVMIILLVTLLFSHIFHQLPGIFQFNNFLSPLSQLLLLSNNPTEAQKSVYLYRMARRRIPKRYHLNSE